MKFVGNKRRSNCLLTLVEKQFQDSDAFSPMKRFLLVLWVLFLVKAMKIELLYVRCYFVGAAKPRGGTNEYVRHGTRTLLASLDIAA